MKTRISTILIMSVMFGQFAGCSEDETQTTEQPVAVSDAIDKGVDERADGANSADASSADVRTADESESDTGQVDGGQATDAGVQDARIIDDAMPDAGDMPVGSAGCGAGQSPPSGVYQIDVDGTMREYHIVIPENYDASRLHKLIFVFHGLGGTAEREVERGFFGLLGQNDGSAIFVAGQGLSQPSARDPNEPGPTGWSNRDGGDVNFIRVVLAKMRADYCIDNARVFSTGWSFGGIMTNRLGCELKDELRAIAPVMGQGPEIWSQMDCSRLRQTADCVDGQVAVWLSHGTEDTIVPYCTGERSRDFWQAQNGCAAQSTPIGENGCIEYDNCDQGYPVVWCQTDLSHLVPPFAGEEIWRFFSRF